MSTHQLPKSLERGIALRAAKDAVRKLHPRLMARNPVMFVVEVGGEWKIARLEETERVKTLVPYGTPVR